MRGCSGPELDDGDVGEGVGADEVGLDLLAVPERAEHAGGMAGDVVVGDDEAVLGDDRAAADALHLDLAPLAVIGGDDADADEGGADMGDGGIHLGMQRGGGGPRSGGGTGRPQGRGDPRGQKAFQQTGTLNSDHPRFVEQTHAVASLESPAASP